MIVKVIKVKCLNCQLEIKTGKISCGAGTFGKNTDLSGYGLAASKPIITQCKRCSYLFCQTRLNVNYKLLSEYIKSEEYQKLLRTNERKFLIIYHIYKNVNLPLVDQNKILLYNYYDTKNIDDLKRLVGGYRLFLKVHTLKDEEFVFVSMMIGEYYRRTMQYDQAKEIFTKLINLTIAKELNILEMCYLQLELIQKQKNEIYNI